MGEIRRIVIHVSDTPDDRDLDVEDIRRYHTAAPPAGRGWNDIGYHEVFKRNGVRQVGRPHDGDSILVGAEIGAHTYAYNSSSLGLCWIGRTKPTADQYDAMIMRVVELLQLYGLSVRDVYGHCELDSKKTCPNIDMDEFRDQVAIALLAC